MTLRIGINGLGRIGRCVLRALYETQAREIELVAVNGPAPVDTHMHLLKYDSVHGRFPVEVKAEGEVLMIGGRKIALSHHKDPKQIPWGKLGV
ncbi:MAG: erythrose-4-phosphate dehydrogenase, partial [Pseudomonadota bacterium]|nr:erythrose-4-phosphate dehydrogenase [Pseudomonadota bacterium]